MKKYFLTEEYLIKEYIIKKKTIKQIANDINCSSVIISRYFKKYNIKTRSNKENIKLFPHKHKTDCLCLMCKCKRGETKNKNHPNYIDGRTTKIYYCIDCKKEITSYLNKRCKNCSNKEIANRKDVKEKMSKNSKKRIGKKNGMWRGGITLLHTLIRGLEKNNIWRTSVFKRDNYTCKECFQVGGSLEAHHIKEFRDIFQEFLIKYNQLSPTDDKETLVRLAIKYKPFWDVNNGISLCRKCHDKTKHDYARLTDTSI